MPYTELPNSSFLDFASWRSGASAPTGGPAVTSFTLNVALILDRADEPSTLLNANWASRQQQLDTLNDNGTLWSTYGADTAKYNQVKAELAGLGIKTVEQVAAEQGVQSGYIGLNCAPSGCRSTTATSTSCSVKASPCVANRQQLALAGQPLASRRLGEHARRQGPVVRHDQLQPPPLVPNPGHGTLVPLPQGWQSPGNASTSPTNISPAADR